MQGSADLSDAFPLLSIFVKTETHANYQQDLAVHHAVTLRAQNQPDHGHQFQESSSDPMTGFYLRDYAMHTKIKINKSYFHLEIRPLLDRTFRKLNLNHLMLTDLNICNRLFNPTLIIFQMYSDLF